MGDGKKIVPIHAEEGAGARVRRLFPTPRLSNLDPFVMFDEFFVSPPAGFPTHPHRGFEAITYVLAGAFAHRDNLGNATTVTAGGAQRFTAGSGMQHSEMPGTAGLNHGLQLWINLPRRLKKIAPTYQQVEPEDIPEHRSDGVCIRTVVGADSPVQLQTPTVYLDIELGRGRARHFDILYGYAGFLYLILGKIVVDELPVSSSEAVHLEGVRAVSVTAAEDSRLVLIVGTPHREAIRRWGPYVD